MASRTLDAVEWNNSTLLEADVAEAVAVLKAQDAPEIQVHGSSDLIQTLLEHDLVDEFRLMIFPVVVGPGKRLFGSGTVPGGLQLVRSRTSSTGVVMLTYRRSDDIKARLLRPSRIPLTRRSSAAAASPTSTARERTQGIILWMQQSVEGYVEGANGDFNWPIVLPEPTPVFTRRHTGLRCSSRTTTRSAFR